MSETLTETYTPPAVADVPAPVSDAERLKLVDALRGIALLGILLMNIPGFAMPKYFSESFKSDPTKLNFWVSAVISVFFEGKMRALFGMIFGAGVLLFTSRKEQSGRSAAALFYRRMGWLVLFGLIHAHLILWIGDILYLYGICGMIVYLFRKVKPQYLVLAVPLVAICDFTAGTLLYKYARDARVAYVQSTAAAAENKPITDAQKNGAERWKEIEKNFLPNHEDAKKIDKKMKSNYSTVASQLRPLALTLETVFLPVELWDSLALMLLGLALFQWGFLTGQWSNRTYATVAAIGYGIGLPLAAYSFYHSYRTTPNLEAMLRQMELVPIQWTRLIYPFQRIFLVMAHVSAIVLLYKSNFAQKLFRHLEAVGQMALTNYISQSIICTLFFFGYGLNFYGELDYYQIYFVALAIWVFQLLVSPVWLRYFRFGPLEWIWRSLTYWRRQPLVRHA
jgi:uncharacterized protein